MIRKQDSLKTIRVLHKSEDNTGVVTQSNGVHMAYRLSNLTDLLVIHERLVGASEIPKPIGSFCLHCITQHLLLGIGTDFDRPSLKKWAGVFIGFGQQHGFEIGNKRSKN
jgi:hypothetical protein